MRNVTEIMGISKEELSGSSSQKDGSTGKRSAQAKRKLLIWLVGVVVSFLPLCALPIYNCAETRDFLKVPYQMFCDAGVIFVAVSFTVASLNDFASSEIRKGREGWAAINCVLLLLGTLLYSVMVIKESSDYSIQTELFFHVNLCYFGLMFLLSIGKYVKDICLGDCKS